MYHKAELIREGKTKQIWAVQDHSDKVIVVSKDDITAGDGMRHDILQGKGAVSNTTTCNVFAHLKRELTSFGVSTAFLERLSDTEMLAKKCTMLPLEVVVRRLAQGSIIKRNPMMKELTRFDPVRNEFFLKTSGKQWRGIPIPKDDPWIAKHCIEGKDLHLFLPDQPEYNQPSFLTIPSSDVFGSKNSVHCFGVMKRQAEGVFLALEDAYREAGGFELVDFKIEFGFDPDDQLVVADVIDAESIRLRRDGKNYDKQPYRDGGLSPVIMERFREVMAATEKFTTL